MPISTDNKRLKRRLAAIMFADIKGYSRLMGEDEEETHRRTSACLKEFRKVIKSYQGRVIRSEGDRIFARFDSAMDAITYALEMQKTIGAQNRDIPAEKWIEFRIGINLGEVLSEAGEIFGENVNIAARLETIAPPGGVCISKAVHDQIGGRLTCQFEYLGPQQLKNIKAPVDAFRVRPERQSTLMLPNLAKEPEQLTLPEKPSVAVLPFVNLNPNARDGYLSDGITEDVTIGLSKFRDLFVIARNSSYRYKHSPLSGSEIAQELGVRYLLEGGVRCEGERLRVTTHFTDTTDGREIWGEVFDRPLGDIFAVQDELVETIVSRLAIRIQESESKRIMETQTKDLLAYGFLLRGQEMLFQYDRRSNAEARRLYESALKLDPGYARAYASISRTINIDWRYSWGGESERKLDDALEYANRSVQLDRFDARGYSELGFVYLYQKEHGASISAYERALDLNPNESDMLAEMGDSLAATGRPDEAVDVIEKAMRLNPYYPDWYAWYLGGAYYQSCEYEQAIKAIQKMNNLAQGRRILAAANAQLGDLTEARRQAEEVLKVHPDFKLDHWEEIQPDKNPDDTKHFIEGLRKAGLR